MVTGGRSIRWTAALLAGATLAGCGDDYGDDGTDGPGPATQGQVDLGAKPARIIGLELLRGSLYISVHGAGRENGVDEAVSDDRPNDRQA